MATPKRKFRFVVSGLGTLDAQNTDFWIEYTSELRDDGPPLLGLIVHGVWETVAGADGLAKRKAVEDRLKLILWSYKGRKGTLDCALQTDGSWVGTGSTQFVDVKLEEVEINQGDNNACLEYTLTFTYAINGLVARELIFTGVSSKTITAQVFIVLKSGEDRTVFKPTFRSGFIRIPDGPPLKITRVIAIRQALAGATDALKRANAESELEAWAFTRIGSEGTLTLDGVSQGTHHLRSVSPGELGLLDAMTFELEFVSNYGS